MLESARFFDWELDPDRIRAALTGAETYCQSQVPRLRHRIRLLVDRNGQCEWQAIPFPCSGRQHWTIKLDDRPVDAANPFLRHKTTQRQVYDQALARHPTFDDVLLWNTRGELTESTRANIVLDLDGRWLTPAVSCGLLPGTYRAEWLERGRIREAHLTVDALAQARKILLINSVRGVIRARWIQDGSSDGVR